MKLKLEFADGSIKHVTVPSAPTQITIEVPIHKFSPEDKSFEGLWITDTQLFVEVLSSAEAYTLNSAGGRMVFAKVGAEGLLYIDKIKSCKLVQSKIGDEVFVKGTRVAWPILKPIERADREV